MHNRVFLHFLLILTLAFTGCNNEDTPDATPDSGEQPGGPIIRSEKQNFRIDTLATGLISPWGAAFLPDGRILITEKAGQIRVVQNGRLLNDRVQGVPTVYTNGQGGLLDIKLHPGYAQNGWVYLTYSKAGPGGGGTVLARARVQGNALADLQELYAAQPLTNSGVHFGSRIAFDGKGYVYLSTGDRGAPQNAQNLANSWGKIIRLREDGQIPPDNPFVNTPNARPEIWSYGHRNVQGMYYDQGRDRLWAHEHGPRGGDEINMVTKGRNYGWPLITHGVNYDGTPVSGASQGEGLEQPIRYWVPSIAPSGLTVVNGNLYPRWQGNLLVGALAGTHLARVELSGDAYAREEKLLDKIGRVRAVVQSPDGHIYLTTEGTGLLVKLVPAQ